MICAPSSWYTVAISSPMIPPPITSSRPGTSSTSSAPVESMTRGSDAGMNGSVIASEPAAMIACSKPTETAPPSASSTASSCGEVNRP